MSELPPNHESDGGRITERRSSILLGANKPAASRSVSFSDNGGSTSRPIAEVRALAAGETGRKPNTYSAEVTSEIIRPGEAEPPFRVVFQPIYPYIGPTEPIVQQAIAATAPTALCDPPRKRLRLQITGVSGQVVDVALPAGWTVRCGLTLPPGYCVRKNTNQPPVGPLAEHRLGPPRITTINPPPKPKAPVSTGPTVKIPEEPKEPIANSTRLTTSKPKRIVRIQLRKLSDRTIRQGTKRKFPK